MKNNFKSITSKPEDHSTAAWADMEEFEPETNIAIPSQEQVVNAKNWVDSNEK